MWDEQAAVLPSRYRLLRYDTRGHGHSDVTPAPYTMEQLADDVAGLLDSLGIKKTHFVGLSLGGMTAQVLAVCVRSKQFAGSCDRKFSVDARSIEEIRVPCRALTHLAGELPLVADVDLCSRGSFDDVHQSSALILKPRIA